jgi:hypothetical protein
VEESSFSGKFCRDFDGAKAKASIRSHRSPPIHRIDASRKSDQNILGVGELIIEGLKARIDDIPASQKHDLAFKRVIDFLNAKQNGLIVDCSLQPKNIHFATCSASDFIACLGDR